MIVARSLAVAALTAAGVALYSSAAIAQDAVFIESASALTAYLSLQAEQPVMADKSSGREKADGRIIWHPALDGEKGILFASFESAQQIGRYLRRKGDALVVEKDDGTPEFARDASFKVKFAAGGSLSLESISRPGYFIRMQRTAVVLEATDHSPAFDAEIRYFRVPADAP